MAPSGKQTTSKRASRSKIDDALSAPLMRKEIDGLAATLDLSPARVRKALEAASSLDDAGLDVVDRLIDLSRSDPEDRRAPSIVSALRSTLELFRCAEGDDPLAAVDATPFEDVVSASLLVERESAAARDAILRQCVGVEDVARTLKKSRQAVEALRRKKRILALRVRRRWRYPLWQFDPDAPGGVLEGIAQVGEALELSPTGVARWLLEPRDELDGARPLDLLRRRESDRVIELAAADGRMA